MLRGARRWTARALRFGARLVEAPKSALVEFRGASAQRDAPDSQEGPHLAEPLAPGERPAVGGPLDEDGLDVVLTIDARDVADGGGAVEDLARLASALVADGAGVHAVVYEDEPREGLVHQPLSLPPELPLLRPRVVRGWHVAVARALPALRGATTVLVDSSARVGPDEVRRLARAVVDDVVVAQAVVRDVDDTVATAGCHFASAGAAPASLFAGFPPEDVEALGTFDVSATDGPVVALRTTVLTVPPATGDLPLCVAATSLEALRRTGSGARAVAVPLGRVYRVRAPRRRSDDVALELLHEWGRREDDEALRVLRRAGVSTAHVSTAPVRDPGRVPLRVARPHFVPVHVDERTPSLRWSLKTAAWAGARGDDWGDVFFARDLAAALRDLGQRVVLDSRQTTVRPESEHLDDVSLVLRGLDRIGPTPGAVNLLWVISHPDLVGPSELASFDRRWAAGGAWARRVTASTGSTVDWLPQATDPLRFEPGPVDPELRSELLFVGKTRGVFRPVVRDALELDLPLTIWGEGWDELVGPERVRGTFLPNERLPAAYRSAQVVLNDHWADMAREGFVSNRLFDAVAAGAVVVTDEVEGLDELFGDRVVPYRDSADLLSAVRQARTIAEDARSREAAAVLGDRHSFRRRAEVLLAAAVREIDGRRR